MTSKIIISIIVALVFAACRNTHTQEPSKPETPKALESSYDSYEIVSKRGYEDLVESLYSELVSKHKDLQQLESKIAQLDKSKNDTTYLFNKFEEKNQSYFSAANKHIEAIKDSLLRDKMRELIENNLRKYNASIAKHKDLLSIMEAKDLTITDLHQILKMVKTLPLMEQYQHDNLPNTKSFEGYIKRQDETLKTLDTLIKK